MQHNVPGMSKGRGEEGRLSKESWRLPHLLDQSRAARRGWGPEASIDGPVRPAGQRMRGDPWRALAPSRPPGPSAGQLAHGVLCRRISSGAHTAALIRHTQGLHSRRAGLADSLGRAGGKDTHSCCPRVSSLSTGTNSRSNPPPQQAQCWGPGGPLPPRLTPRLGPAPALAAPLHNWMPSPGRGRRAMGVCRRRWPGQLWVFNFPLIW